VVLGAGRRKAVRNLLEIDFLTSRFASPTQPIWLVNSKSEYRVDMALEVPQRIYKRLVAVIDDLRNAVGQDAANAFLVSLTNIEPVEFEPESPICDSWIEFINEDLINNTSEPPQSTPSSPSGKIEDPSLRTISLQTEANAYCPALSLYTAGPISPNRSTTLGPCEHYRESEARQKRGRSDDNILEAAVQGLPCSDLVDCLETY